MRNDHLSLKGLATYGANNIVGELNSVYTLLKKDIPNLQLN